jgi:hypothetical protein
VKIQLFTEYAPNTIDGRMDKENHLFFWLASATIRRPTKRIKSGCRPPKKNFESRALVMVRLMISTRRYRHPKVLERIHSFEAIPRLMYISMVVAVPLSRRRANEAKISDMYMPRFLVSDLFSISTWKALTAQLICPIHRTSRFGNVIVVKNLASASKSDQAETRSRFSYREYYIQTRATLTNRNSMVLKS